jgi:hypothetical protein
MGIESLANELIDLGDTLGTFLGAFTFGHVRQPDRLAEAVLTRA